MAIVKFEWQTEEERGPGHPEPSLPQPAGRSGRRWLWIVLSLALVAAAVAVTWRQVNERVDEASAVVKEDVLSSHTLARRAAAAKDEELFVSILSGRDSRWTEAQKERLRNGLLFEDALRPFRFRPLDRPARDVEVTLNPELSEAVVRTVQPFTVDAGEGLTATVHLTQTHVYRQGSQRWLLSPPDAAFWGSWQTVDGDRLTVVAPERDQALAERLARDIEAKLGEMCGEVVACPRGFHVRLRLEKDPASVNEARERARGLGSDEGLTLPAPTLLGLPADEAAYEALTRAYARQAVAAAITSLAEYECCDGLLFFRATLEMQMAQLDLRSPPLESGAYRHLLDIPTSAQHLSRLWDQEELRAEAPSIPLEIYSLVHFLQQQDDGSAASRLQRMQDSFGATFWDWIRDNYRGLEWTVFEDRWTRFVQDSIREGQEASAWPQGVALPQQDLVAVCGEGLQDVYRYDLDDGQWSKEVEAGLEFALFSPLPGDDGYIVAGQLPADGEIPRNTTFLKRTGQESLTLAGGERSETLLIPWNVVEPGGQRMVVWLLGNAGGANWDPRAALLDPATCGEQGCTFEELSGMPVWSPDGSQRITVDIFVEILDGFTVYYEAGGLEQQTSAGTAWPFWLDNETFGLVGPATTGRSQPLRVTNVRSGKTATLLTSQEVLMAIPRERRPAAVKFVALLAHPWHPHRILAVVAPYDVDGESFLLEIRRPAEPEAWTDVEPEVALLESFTGVAQENWSGVAYTLNGRWLTLRVQEYGNQGGPGLVIYDLQEERLVLDSAAPANDDYSRQDGDWSADGTWFAHNLAQRIDLIAPGITVDGGPARQAIFHEFGQCASVGWVDG